MKPTIRDPGSMKHILFCFFLLCSVIVFSQPDESLLPLRSSGKIPKEFTISSLEKYEKQRAEIKISRDKQLNQIQDDFYLESNFILDNFLLSGKVLFNDPLSEYVNKVADEILKDDPGLRAKLRFYTVKSAFPNAFASDRGNIFVNVGLIARLESEAHLAYILCHEISHYLKRHTLNKYLEFKNLEYSDKSYQRSSVYEKLLVKNNYTQASEIEADAEGFKLFAKTNYELETLPEVFDMLAAVDKPYSLAIEKGEMFFSPYFTSGDFDELTKNIWISGNPAKSKDSEKVTYIFDRDESDEEEGISEEEKEGTSDQSEVEEMKNRETEITNVDNSSEEENQDPESSHPSPQKRKKLVQSRIEKLGAEKKERSAFLVSVADFFQIRELARYELAGLYMERYNFFDAIYQSLLIKAENGKSSFTDIVLAKALYGFSKYKFHDESNNPVLDYRSVPEESKKWWKYFDSMTGISLEILALAYCWHKHEEYPDNELLPMLAEDLAYDILDPYPDFSNIKLSWRRDTIAARVIGKLMQAPGFEKVYEAAKERKKEDEEWEEYLATEVGEKKYEAWMKKIDKKGWRMGIDSVLVFDPVYYRVDTRDEQHPFRFVESDDMQAKMHSIIQNGSRELGINLVLLDNKALTSQTSVARYNEYMELSQWHDELLNPNEFAIIPSNYDRVLEISRKYNIHHFANLAVLSVKARKSKSQQITTCFYGVWCLPLFPVFAVLAFKPYEQSLYYTFVYDIRTNKRVMNYVNFTKSKARENDVSQKVRFGLFQIKKENY